MIAIVAIAATVMIVAVSATAIFVFSFVFYFWVSLRFVVFQKGLQIRATAATTAVQMIAVVRTTVIFNYLFHFVCF